MYETILVPLDGSDTATVVLPHVVEIGARFGSRVLLLEAVPTLAEVVRETMPYDPTFTAPAAAAVSVDVAGEAYDAEKASAEHHLERAKRWLEGHGLQTAETMMREGHPADVILKVAREFGVTLLAMSKHGRTGIGRVVFGSVTDEVLRRSHL